jgi:hypothetical protein
VQCEPARRDACSIWREGTGFGCWNAEHASLRGVAGLLPERCRACEVYRTSVLPPCLAAGGCPREDA